MSPRAFVAVFLLTSMVFAQAAPIRRIPEGEDRITSMTQGQEAPYSGQLFDPPTALRWANALEQYKMRLEDDVEREKQVCEIKTEYSEKVLAAEKERAVIVEADLRIRLHRSEQARLKAEHELRNPTWYRTTWFGVVTGVVGAAAFFGLSAWAVNSSKN